MGVWARRAPVGWDYWLPGAEGDLAGGRRGVASYSCGTGLGTRLLQDLRWPIWAGGCLALGLGEAPLLDEARATGIAVMGDLDLFARALAALKATQAYAPQPPATPGPTGTTPTPAQTAPPVQPARHPVAIARTLRPHPA